MDDLSIFDRPRTWKYALPWAMVVLLIPVTGKMMASLNPEIRYWSMLPSGFIVLFGIIGLLDLWKYMSAHNVDLFERQQNALSMTPLVLLSQNMKQMHPEAVRVLNRFGVRTSWQVRVNANLGERDWVLADTNVHFGFIEYILLNSKTSLYPKYRLSEGSKKWDPDGLVEDRVQHQEFEMWLFARLMVTRSHGDYKPAEFIPPWTPNLIMEILGLTGEQDLYHPDENMRKDLNIQPSGNGNGRNAAKPEPVPANEPDLSAADLEAINQENLKYSEKYRIDI